ncbi:amino acid adenylation domain-containing protein [Chitinivorax tropicus]|uniref:Amino acid adenylation domain-containing protein n=1 Tax=Chitinivorax tropicus TaxID=714531 RepID=A0A840MND2_9PROT|nr:non-ribosomal peptide synthetase [Chitinivorax tropicus]MBB5016751.1 amino acid adenylation domain-containing protein [Chitinivorax tropicus]
MQAPSYLFKPSFSQQRLWLLDQLEPASTQYHIATALRLVGPLHVPALQQALDAVIARHESLRTCFVYDQGELQQCCLETLSVPIRLHELADAEPTTLQAFALAQYHQPFDLSQAPLLRVDLAACGPQDHLLVIIQHHIISDGVSSGIFARELADAYRAACQGQAPDWAELPIQYADYAAWQRQQTATPEHQAALQYWLQQLRGAEPLALPTDRPRPARQSFKGATLFTELPASVVEALAQRARRQGSTLFMTLLTAFYALLHRYTGQSDLVIGTPVAGRQQPELDNLIGFFVNTLALRVQLDPAQTFQQLLSQVREVVLAGQSHQQVPFDQVVERLNLARDLSHAPVFQVMFAYQEVDEAGWSFDQLQVTPLQLATDTSKFDLTLSLVNAPDQLSVALEYSTDLFDTDTAARFGQHFITLLTGIAADDARPILDYPLLGDAERHQLLSGWDQPLTHHPVDLCLHQLFERQARLTPHAEALTAGHQRLSYQSLNARANRLAHYLLNAVHERGGQPVGQPLIGICLPRQEELVVAILAVMKAGYGYLPIDPALSAERIGFYVADAQVSLVVTQAEYSVLFDERSIDTVCVDSERPFIQSMSEDNPALPCTPEQLAYVIYTSGSTGQPKGVMVTHLNVLRLFKATQDWFQFDQQDVWTLFHSTAFDFSVWEIWGALLHGGRLVVVPYLVSRSPEAFHQLVVRERVTVLNQTPSAFKQFIAADQAAGLSADAMQLRCVVFGGEALEPASLLPWLDKYGEDRPQLINMYGITETTVHVTYRPIRRADAERVGSSPIGVAIPDLRLFILDSQRRPAPIGVIGELYVAGDGVALGYLNRTALTAERFIDWPADLMLAVGYQPGTKLYKTGDLARFLSDGGIEYKGRADDQVKIRGFRIELGEIEAALRQSEQVKEVVVQTWRDTPTADARLVAYVVPAVDDVKVEQLRSLLKTMLPDYMVPAHFLFLTALPLTNNGKIDRKALPAPQTDRPQLASDYVAPGNPAEQQLVAGWCRVLGLSQIGIHDNFFALGGDSLRGVQAIAKAREAGLSLSLVDLFAHQTIAELAKLAASRAGDEQGVETIKVPFGLINEADRARMPDTAIDAYPLSRMQGAMFYHMQISPTANVYHCTGTSHLRLGSPFDEAAFREAVRRTVARHDILRIGFDLTGCSEPLQIVHREAVLPVVVEDLRHFSEAEQIEQIKALLEQEKHTPFDFAKPTLLRFFIQLRSDRSLQFTMTECHPIYDGWSYHTMIVEVFNRYAGLTGDSTFVEPPPLQVSYRDFIEKELAAVADPAHQQFWSDWLDDCTVLRLPRLPGYQQHSHDPSLKAIRLSLPESVYAGLQRLMHAASVPMKSVLLAGHIKVMSLISGETDILTGIPTNGRPEEVGGDQLYGLFLNTLPFRYALEESSWQALVKGVFAKECAAMPYRRYPLAEIQRQFGKTPLLPDVLFNYMDFHVYDQLDSKLGFEVVDTLDTGEVNEGTNFPLNVHFQHLTLSSKLTRHQISIQIDFDEHQLAREQVDLLAHFYQQVFAAMANEPSALHHQQDFLPVPMRQQLLGVLAGAASSSTMAKQTLADAFAAQVAAKPDQVALIDGDSQLSYQALNARANQLAHYLVGQGLQPGEPVAIHLGRSSMLVVAMLALIKAQAIYVPIDLDDPRERIDNILADTGCKLMLTEERGLTRLGGVPAQLLVLDRISTLVNQYPTLDLPCDDQANTAAYIMYTSGSTGVPKGAVIPQQGIIRLVCRPGDIDLAQHGRILQLSSIAFDAATFEIWGALLNGGTLVLYPASLPSIPVLESIIAQHQIQTLFLTTSLFNTVVDERPSLLAPVQQVFTGGEAMSLSHARKLLAALPRLRLFNGYGPTENTTFTTLHELDVNRLDQPDSVPLGRPIKATQVYVLDRFQNLAPIGTPGELYTGGAGVARGYLNREALNAERFIADPFHGDAGARLYRTGDRAAFLPDGNLIYLGRLDGQVKIRGFRIEPGEIEHALRQHPQVKQAVVRIVEEPSGKRIAAYVVAEPGLAQDPITLKTFAAQWLPKYMVPNHLIFLPQLPLKRNGKVDLKALPAPQQATEPAALRSPGNQRERDIQGVWAQVLEIDQPGIDENFFDLGGHSLLLARVHQQLRAKGYEDLSIVDLLNYPTIHALASHLEQGPRQSGAQAAATAQKMAAGRQRLAELQKQKQNA